MTLAAFVAIYFVHLAAAISPGPAVLLAARTGLREGFARGSWLAVGIGLGACIWACAAPAVSITRSTTPTFPKATLTSR